MNENIENQVSNSSDLESEIALLTKEIESKRRLLEQEKGIIDQSDAKDLIRQSLPVVASDLANTNQTQDSPDPTGELLLDETSRTKIEELIQEVKNSGIAKAVNKAKAESAYILDIFHDVLVDHLYDELKKNKIIK